MAAMKRLLPLLCALLPLAVAAAELPLHLIKLPPGFAIELFARVDNARGMALGAQNTLFVGSMRAGKVHALKFDARYKVTRSHLVAEGLQLPVGVAFRDGALYVSAVSRILRFDGIENRLAQLPYSPPPPAVVRDDFPRETHHGWKFIAFGPDGRLYVPVGAPCNICAPDPERYANILRMNPDGSNLEVFARGVRNTVGFAWHPETRELWFTDNGRDWLGDDAPPGRTQPPRRVPACTSAIPTATAARWPTRVRREAGLRRFRSAGAEPGAACRRARHALLRRRDVPAGIPPAGLHRRARLVEPDEEDRLPRVAGAPAGRQGGRLRALRRGLAAGRIGLGPAGRPAGAARRFAAGLRRPRRGHLSHLPCAAVKH
jgi:hypothetical protein